MTAVWVPQGVDWKSFNGTLKSDLGITFAGGQEEYAGKIFRISHLGYYDDLDAIACIAALERALAVHNHKFTPGAGVTAAHKALFEP